MNKAKQHISHSSLLAVKTTKKIVFVWKFVLKYCHPQAQLSKANSKVSKVKLNKQKMM